MAITITKPTIGGSEDTWGLTINNALDDVAAALNGTAGTVAPDHTVLTINGTDVTSTAAELNILDGVTATAAELNILDGVTATAAELNILDGVTATAAELNILDGVTATAAEINYLDGVTSPIQTQINSIIAGESGGTVTSVGLSVPTGFAVSGSPVTTSGTLGLSFASGYSLLTSAQATSISNIPTATSQLTNDSGFITSQYTQPTTLGDVGTYALMQNHSGISVSAGGTVSGSSLKYHNINFSETGTPAASGNWRVMGRFAGSGTGTTNAISVCLRIA